MNRKRALTHLDPSGRPTMVDVSGKAVSVREARAECRVRFPADLLVGRIVSVQKKEFGKFQVLLGFEPE